MDKTAEQSEAYGVVGRLRQPGWHWSLALLLAGFYIGTCLYISAHRLLWFDEILTAITTRLPSVRTMWKALSQVSEQTPPLYFLITRLFDRLFGPSDIGLRIPSALALGAGLLVAFDTARRLTDGLFGLIAMSFLTTSFVTYYGHEARSYALYFMLAAVALWLWVFTREESKTAAAAFGAVFLAGLAIHYYVLLCLAPFGIMALAEKRIFHPKVIAGTAGALVSLAILYPQIAASRTFLNSVAPVWEPSTTVLQPSYLELFPNAILPLVLIALGVVTFGRPRKGPVPPMSGAERVSWLFLVVPLAAYILAHLVTHVFHDRYIVGAAPGIAVGVTCLLWRHCRESRYLPLALLLAVGGFGVSQQLRTLRDVDHIPSESGDNQGRTRQTAGIGGHALPRGQAARGCHVGHTVSGDVVLLETPGPVRVRDHPGALGHQELRSAAFRVVEEIVADARQTAVINPPPALAEALEQAGLHLKVRFAEPQYVVYLE